MEILLLIFAHFIGDWSMQHEWVAQNKSKYWFVMFAHCMVWTACICFVLEYLGLLTAWKAVFLFAGHYLMDYWKCKVYDRTPFCEQKTYKHLYIDQLWHILQCVMVGF